MKPKFILLLLVSVCVSVVASAQRFNSDIEDVHLKGKVKSVLTTTRTPQGRIVGQPVRNNFNEDGYFTQNTYYDTLGNPVIIVSFFYDKKNRLVKDVRTHEPYSELLSQTTYVYNKKKKTITAQMFGIADSLEESTVYVFNKEGNIDSVKTLDANGKQINTLKYSYNNFGLRTWSTCSEGDNGIYIGTEKYRYDTDGFLAEQCSYYLATLRQAFLYTYYYDEHGNWIQGHVFHVSPTEGYLYQIIDRQITYYE